MSEVSNTEQALGASGEELHDEAMTMKEVLEEMESMDLAQLVEESLEGVKQGELVRGAVMQITKEFVVVDIGYKSEGQIAIREFLDEQGNVAVQEGDEVDVLLEKLETEDGSIVLSKEKAAQIKVWDVIRESYDKNQPVTGKIVSRVRGGFTVDIGVNAFLPGSQVDLRPVRDLDSVIGKTFDFRVLKYNKRRRNVVISRRTLLEEERAGKRAETLNKLETTDVLPGIVKNITDYGVFIDLGGLDGLLHVTDMSWGKVKHPSDLVKVGDRLNVKILDFDRERMRVSLGLKQLVPDPWATAAERLEVGAKLSGKVVSLTDYGAFVELEPGVEGLVHVSEMSWTSNIRHPSQLLHVGQEVETMILDVQPKSRRVSLGLKQAEANPWDTIEDKYPVGTIIEGRIKSITDFGVFIGIDEGIDGLVHISSLSWTERIDHPSELYEKGQTVQAKVMNIDRENGRFSLSIKHAAPDPWEQAAINYPLHSKVTGTITNVTDFGIFVELERGIEGLVHISEISEEKIDKPADMFKKGDTIESLVINMDERERKIGLSIKRIQGNADQALVREYLNGGRSTFNSLGDLLKESVQARESEQEQEG
jgi:small subunit ribosomal protein S1